MDQIQSGGKDPDFQEAKPAAKHYRRHAGHRQANTRVLKITGKGCAGQEGAKPKAAAAKKAPAKKAPAKKPADDDHSEGRAPAPAKKAAPAKKSTGQRRPPPRKPQRPKPIAPIARRIDPWRIKKQAAARVMGATHRVNGWA